MSNYHTIAIYKRDKWGKLHFQMLMRADKNRAVAKQHYAYLVENLKPGQWVELEFEEMRIHASETGEKLPHEVYAEFVRDAF